MGIKRTHVAWTTKEEQTLRDKWPTAEPVKEWLPLLAAGRTYQSVISHAACLNLGARPVKIRSKYSAVWDSVRALMAKSPPLTAQEISSKTGFCDRHLRDLLVARLKTDPPQVHIPTWRRRGKAYGYVEAWALGDGPNMPKPKALTRDDVNRQRRMRRIEKKVYEVAGPFATVMQQVMKEAA